MLNETILNIIYPMATSTQSNPISVVSKVFPSSISPFDIPLISYPLATLLAVFALSWITKFFSYNDMKMLVSKFFLSTRMIIPSIKLNIAISTSLNSISSKLRETINTFRHTTLPKIMLFIGNHIRVVLIPTSLRTESNSAIVFFRNPKRVFFASNWPLNRFPAKLADVKFYHTLSTAH